METSINNKCKAYTSLEQSKKLAEILPPESADMCYRPTRDVYGNIDGYSKYPDVMTPRDRKFFYELGYKPGWSLAALLDILPKGEDSDTNLCFGGYEGIEYVPEWFCNIDVVCCTADNPVDACYEMIIKLKERDLL